MSKSRTRIEAISLAALVTSVATPAAGQNPQFLAPAQAVQVLMDGQPWSAQAANGRNIKITLNKDGTGSAQGPMPFPLSVSWEVKGEAVCLNVGPAGTKCLRFRKVADGFEGWLGNQVDLRLTR